MDIIETTRNNNGNNRVVSLQGKQDVFLIKKKYVLPWWLRW